MPKILSWLFWKPKQKSSSSNKKEKHVEDNLVYRYIEPTFDFCNINENKNDLQNYKTLIRKSDCITNNPVCFERRGSQFQDNKIRSYPVSPRKTLNLEHDKSYLSEQNIYIMSRNSSSKPTVHNPSMPTRISNFKPNESLVSNEPFPFETPKDRTPRQSVVYEFRYGDNISTQELDENSKNVAEKPMEEFITKRVSQDRPQCFPSSSHSRDMEIENENQKEKSKPISVRLSTVDKQPSQFVKDMQFRALKPDKQQTQVLVTSDGQVLHPIKRDQLRRNSLSQDLEKSKPTVRVSVVLPVTHEYMRENTCTQSSRRSFRTSLVGQSLFEKNVQPEKLQRFSLMSNRDSSPITLSRKDSQSAEFVSIQPSNKNVRKSFGPLQSVISRKSYDEARNNSTEDNPIVKGKFSSYMLIKNEPIINAVPTIVTRGTRKSVLAQSMKALTSSNRKEDPSVYSKNIRCSTDADVFAAETHRKSTAPASPGFVNMEKGQTTLVSEFLNPLTSLFISDFKDPIPKDPLRKPKESNIWVKPKNYSPQKQSVSKQATKPVRFQQVKQEPPQQVRNQKKTSRNTYYREESSSSSDESIVVYKKKSRNSSPNKLNYHSVYNAEIPSSISPFHDNVEDTKSHTDPHKSSSDNDVCKLDPDSLTIPCIRQEISSENKPSNYNFRMVSSAQQTDMEDELDLICFPSHSVLKNPAEVSESGSKLRWRIVIKRGEVK